MAVVIQKLDADFDIDAAVGSRCAIDREEKELQRQADTSNDTDRNVCDNCDEQEFHD